MEILLLDDHSVVRDGIQALLEQEPDWTVSHSISTLSELRSILKIDVVDMAIIDISLKEESGFQALAHIKDEYPHVKCLVLSMYEHTGYIDKSIEIGADGYVTKTSATSELTDAIVALLSGDNYLSSDIAGKLAFKNGALLDSLTHREKEVFHYLAKGLSPKRIAQLIDTMPKTVMVHRTNIYKKLNVSSPFGLLRLALKEGVLGLNDFVSDIKL